MKQSNKQKIFFQDEGNWYVNWIDLKDVYKHVHSQGTPYGSSADMLLCEMTANVIELMRCGHINIKEGLVIRDYGCGKSRAANIVAKVLSDSANAEIFCDSKAIDIKEAMTFLMPCLRLENERMALMAAPKQIERYGNITVQRYDIGIEEYAKPLKKRADIVFCNDVFEHIPLADMLAFLSELEDSGKYIFASISLRDAVNYSALEERVVKKGAFRCPKPAFDKDHAIMLEKDKSGNYIFSLHVSVLRKEQWQGILSSRWHLLDAQDYTAVSAMNFCPHSDYIAYKRNLIAEVGFADFIAFPTPCGTRYESDPILFERVARMQPSKHIMKLETLTDWPDCPFKAKEEAKSKAFLAYIGLEPDETGRYSLAKLPEDWLDRMYILEARAKDGLEGLDAKEADLRAASRAEAIIRGE